MYVISTFEQSLYLEMAITTLRQQGIPKEHILAVPLDIQNKPRKILDSTHYSDGTSVMDTAALVATFFGTLGTVVGFQLPLGPIAWGLIGLIVGGLLGFSIDYGLNRKRFGAQVNTSTKHGEVVLTVFCAKEQVDSVEKTLWQHFAIGVARLNLTPPKQTAGYT